MIYISISLAIETVDEQTLHMVLFPIKVAGLIGYELCMYFDWKVNEPCLTTIIRANI